MVSDLYDDQAALLNGLQHLRFRGHELIVFHVFDPAELEFPYHGLAEFEDMETGERIEVPGSACREEYRRAVDEFVAFWRSRCSDARIDYQVVDTRTPFDRSLAEYLHKRSRLG